MSGYWERLARLYSDLGEAEFWLKERIRLLDGLEGRGLEVGCGGGRLVLEALVRGVDCYGIDLAPAMIAQARSRAESEGLPGTRFYVADVTRLPFAARSFDSVFATGVIGLLHPDQQFQALKEMARVAAVEVRLLEPFEKQAGFYVGRLLAFMFDGMRPIPPQAFREAGLVPQLQHEIWGGAFAYVRAVKTD